MSKILVWCEDDMSGLGGVAAFSKLLGSELELMGNHVSVYSRKSLYTIREKAPLFQKQLDNIFFAPRFDFVFVQYVPYAFSSIGLPFHMVLSVLFLKLKGVQVVFFFHEVAIRSKGISSKYKLIGFLQKWIAISLNKVSSLSFTSNLLYASYFGEDNNVIVNPIPSNIEEAKLPATKQHSIRVLSFVNRAFEVLFEAVAGLKKSGLDIQLLLVGAATEDHVARAIRYKGSVSYPVTIYSAVSEEEMSQLLNSASIYVQLEKVSDTGEGGASTKSGALAAAYQHGKAIITTRGDMTDERYINEQTVFFVDGNDPLSISRGIEYIIENPEEAISKANNARKCYYEKMDWPCLINSLSILNKY